MNKKLLEYYIDLGFSKFCVGSIEQAKIIKKISFAFEVIGSIVMRIEKQQITDEHNLYFNGFVLWFPFNRNIQKIKEMPKNFRYSLLINCGCNKFCDGIHHWCTNSLEEEQTIYCPNNDPNIEYSFKNSIRIRPQDLFLFKDDITYFKLQGRERPTFEIIQNIILYTTNLQHFNIFENIDYKDIYNLGE